MPVNTDICSNTVYIDEGGVTCQCFPQDGTLVNFVCLCMNVMLVKYIEVLITANLVIGNLLLWHIFIFTFT